MMSLLITLKALLLSSLIAAAAWAADFMQADAPWGAPCRPSAASGGCITLTATVPVQPICPASTGQPRIIAQPSMYQKPMDGPKIGIESLDDVSRYWSADDDDDEPYPYPFPVPGVGMLGWASAASCVQADSMGDAPYVLLVSEGHADAAVPGKSIGPGITTNGQLWVTDSSFVFRCVWSVPVVAYQDAMSHGFAHRSGDDTDSRHKPLAVATNCGTAGRSK